MMELIIKKKLEPMRSGCEGLANQIKTDKSRGFLS